MSFEGDAVRNSVERGLIRAIYVTDVRFIFKAFKMGIN